MRMWQDISKILLPVFIGPTCVCCLPHTATRTVKIFQHLASRHWSFVPKWQIKYVSSGSKLCKIEKKFYLWWVLSFLFSSIFNWWIRSFFPLLKKLIHPVHCYFWETYFLALKFSCSPFLSLNWPKAAAACDFSWPIHSVFADQANFRDHSAVGTFFCWVAAWQFHDSWYSVFLTLRTPKYPRWPPEEESIWSWMDTQLFTS